MITLHKTSEKQEPEITVQVHDHVTIGKLRSAFVAFCFAAGYCEASIREALNVSADDDVWAD